MIKIVRGPEPLTLVDLREEHLSHAMSYTPEDGPAEFKRYAVARPDLFDRQYAKCVYCENWELEESQPVEHFRPKGAATRIDWRALKPSEELTSKADDDRFRRGLPPVEFKRVRWLDGRGYWWLAWTWENFAFGCVSCNGMSRKGTRFPLDRGSSELMRHKQPPGGEQSLLLDPMEPDQDPMDVIRFRWDGKHWRPFAVDDDARAAWTIAVLGLGGPSLLTHYKTWVEILDRLSKPFRMAVACGDEAAIRTEWDELCISALAPNRPFLALAHDWLDTTYQREIKRHSLRLERPRLYHPSARGDATPRPLLPPRPELEGLSAAVQQRIRWLRHHQGPGSVAPLNQLLIDLCRERPSTTEELAALLARTTISSRLDELEGQELRRDPVTNRWHPC